MKTKLIILLISTISTCAFAQVNYDATTYIYTCTGVQVIAHIASMDLSAAQKVTARADFLSQVAPYYGITASDIIDDATPTYNCHAYAWHLTEGNTNRVWLRQTEAGQANLSKYWTGANSCFIEVSSEADADKIFYYSGDHSAVKSTINGKYESKWGQYPVVRHLPNQVPYSSPSDRKYYKKIVIPNHWDYSATMSATYSGFLAEATVVNENSRIDQYSWSIFNANTGATVTNSGWSISAYNSEQGKPAMHRVLVTGGSPLSSSGLRLRVCAHNSAGWGECAPLGNLSNGSYSSFSASPNPASSLLNIEIEDLQPATANAASAQQASPASKNPSAAIPPQPVYEVKIFNTATGAMVYQQTMTGKSKQIDVSGLPNGIYTLSVSDGSGNPPMTQQIVVAH